MTVKSNDKKKRRLASDRLWIGLWSMRECQSISATFASWRGQSDDLMVQEKGLHCSNMPSTLNIYAPDLRIMTLGSRPDDTNLLKE